MLDTDNLARVTSVRTEYEAGIVVGGLEVRGIKAIMSGVNTASFAPKRRDGSKCSSLNRTWQRPKPFWKKFAPNRLTLIGRRWTSASRRFLSVGLGQIATKR
jgi:hypothetical protein